MAETNGSSEGTPPGVIFVCLLVLLYAAFWLLTDVLAAGAPDGPSVVLSAVVGVVVLGVTYSLFRGSRTAWWVAVVAFGVGTAWHLSLVAGGAVDDLTNAVLGVVVLGFLLWRRDYYRPSN